MAEETEKKLCVRWGMVALVVGLILLLYLYLSNTVSESFTLNPSTWEDWDNYGKNAGKSRAYWGRWVPGGGWSGSRYSPENNPGGDYIYPRGDRRYFLPADPYKVDLANSDKEVLQDVIRSQIAE
jgi:hypothetical protein